MTRALLLSALLLSSLAACETIEGAGQDLENAGEAIREQANQAQAGL